MKPAEQTRAALTVDEFHAAAERNKQWGRWRPDDEIGALDNVTPAHVAAATAFKDTVREIELNPVLVHPKGDGCTIVDALILTGPAEAQP
jgi:hypothetical protein